MVRGVSRPHPSDEARVSNTTNITKTYITSSPYHPSGAKTLTDLLFCIVFLGLRDSRGVLPYSIAMKRYRSLHGLFNRYPVCENNNRINKCDVIKIQISEIMGLVGKVKSGGESTVIYALMTP